MTAPTIRPEQTIYTPGEAAEVLRLSRHKVYELCNSGQLRSFKIGRARRIAAAAIADFVAELEGEA